MGGRETESTPHVILRPPFSFVVVVVASPSEGLFLVFIKVLINRTFFFFFA